MLTFLSCHLGISDASSNANDIVDYIILVHVNRMKLLFLGGEGACESLQQNIVPI